LDNTLKLLGDLLQPNGIVRNDKLGIPHSDKNGWLAQLMEALTASNAFAIQQVSWLNAGVDAQGENSAQRLNSALAAVHAAAAKDEVEAMLAKQMAAAHVATMKCPFQLQRSQQNPQFEAHGNMANTRLRTFAVQLVAVAKLRRGGEQTVRVEHSPCPRRRPSTPRWAMRGGQVQKQRRSRTSSPPEDTATTEARSTAPRA